MSPASTTMSLEAACDLSIPELLHVLNKKLGLECTRLREHHSPATPTTTLEGEIKSLETRAHDVLRLIPSLQNLLQPVNRLPPEILSRIARCLLPEYPPDARPIVPLTQVCRYWRQSITSIPANWVRISNLRKGLMALSLERAKAAPLEVFLRMNTKDSGLFDLLAPYVQNIDTLRINNATIEKIRQALPGFPQSTPSLRSLRFNSDVGADWDHSTDPFESLASTLKYLKLSSIPLYPSILHLRSLTEFTYFNDRADFHLDTLLDFLEENRLLEGVILGLSFEEASLRSSRRRTAIQNQLRYLSVYYQDVRSGQAIISNIGLRRGAHFNISTVRADGGSDNVLLGLSTAHLLNLRSPTLMEYRSYPRNIQLFGPNGRFSLQRHTIPGGGIPFAEFPLLPLTHVRELRLTHRLPELIQQTVSPQAFDQSSFPALETLVVDCGTSVSHLLSALFSNPSSPSLKTLTFMNCDLTEKFVEELTQYASKRGGITSAPLYKVVIIHPDGVFPSIASIRKLEEHVSVIDVRMGTKLPKDLT